MTPEQEEERFGVVDVERRNGVVTRHIRVHPAFYDLLGPLIERCIQGWSPMRGLLYKSDTVQILQCVDCIVIEVRAGTEWVSSMPIPIEAWRRIVPTEPYQSEIVPIEGGV